LVTLILVSAEGGTDFMNEKTNDYFEVLSPWADIDPVPARGIAQRLPELKNKTIGLFDNGKRAARPMLTVAERKLKEKIPGIQFKWYDPPQRLQYSTSQSESENKDYFAGWAKQIDGAITAVGD
jgi:hypothetical protein